MLNPKKTASFLGEALRKRLRIDAVEVTGSTNSDLKAAAQRGKPEGYVLIAGEQTAGRGRQGRSFYSPKDTGLYMSVLLRPKADISEALFITVCAAAAVSRAADSVYGVSTGIKWVNDIYLGGRKVCGILTEAAASPGGGISYAVLGIGINVASAGFPDEIKDKAGALCEKASRVEELAAAILENFFGYYDDLGARAFMEEYSRRSILTGKRVTFKRGNGTLTAAVTGIDSRARLVVRTDGGETLRLDSGEVTLVSF